MSAERDVSVRRAEAGDLDAVALVWHESACAMDGAAPAIPPIGVLRDRIDAELRSGWELHVAVRGGRIVGVLALKPAEAALDQIFVAPAEQGTGVGRALVAVAKREMPGGFTLRMAAANGMAARFYEKEGLSAAGDGLHPWTGIPVRYYRWSAT